MTVQKFVGRSNELVDIRKWLRRSTGGLVLITGAGGIGKTSLLQEIKREYSDNEKFVVEYFDLAEQPVALINQVVHLAHTIGFDKLPKFEQRINNLGYQSGESVQTYQRLVDEAVDIALREITSYFKACNKKLLLLTDTYEIVLKYFSYDEQRVTSSYEIFKKIPDTFFVVAGRDKLNDSSVKKEVYPIMKRLFGEKNILPITLSGFDDFEVKDFFAELDKHHMIPDEMREKLYLLTGGRPILLSLSVEWLQKEIPLPVMIEMSLPKLRRQVKSKTSGKELLNSFEFELVSRVRELQTPLDVAILYMAQLERRMDSHLLSILLNMDGAGAEQAMSALARLTFTKEFVGAVPAKYTLHDEMSVLVNKYAWQFLDRSGEERIRITRKAIKEYYFSRINEIKQQKKKLLQQEKQTSILQDVQARESDWERWLLEAETLYYFLKVSKEEGYAYFDELYYDREKSDIRDQFLIDELKRAGAYDENKIALRKADDLRRRGQVEQARTICQTALKKSNLNIADQIHAYTILGLVNAESNPVDAEESLLKALALSTSKGDERVQSILHNNLGRLYRSTSRLAKSIEHYKQAFEIARQSSNFEMASIARNNLAWTYRLDGNLVDADSLCSLSIAENRRRGQERPLAYAYLTKADIDRERGELQSAERYANLALDIFSRLDDVDGKVQAYRSLAIIYRILRKFEQSLKYLETGIALVEKRNSLPLLASLKQLYGRTIRHYADYMHSENNPSQSKLFKKALGVLQESVSLAEQARNPWEVARSKIEIALIMILDSDSYDEVKLNQLLREVKKVATSLKDELLMGYVYENRARIELTKKRYLDAGREFGEAACHLANRTGLEARLAFDRLHAELLDEKISEKERDAMAKGVLQQLKKLGCTESPALAALKNMCDEIIASPI